MSFNDQFIVSLSDDLDNPGLTGETVDDYDDNDEDYELSQRRDVSDPHQHPDSCLQQSLTQPHQTKQMYLQMM